MPKKEKSIGINALLNGIKTIFTVIFPLITYPYAARILQVENMGKVDFSNSVVSYFVLFAGLGISTYAIREGSGVRDNKEKLEKFSNEMFSINLFTSIIASILLCITAILVPKFHSYYVLILVQSLVIFGNLVGVLWLYTIKEDYAYITIRSLVVHILALVLLFTFVHKQNDYVMYAATTVIANVGANILNFFHAKKYVKIKIVKDIDWKKHLKPILIIFASTITTTIYVNSDKTILGFLSDEYHVGLYSVSVNIYSVLKAVIAAVILVSLPRLSNYVANKRDDEFRDTASYIYKTFMLLLIPLIVGVYMTADTIVTLIGGTSYLEAVTSLKILAFSLLFSMIATFYSNAILLPHKKETIVLKATVISAILNVGLNFILLKTFKQDGAAFTTLIAEFSMCLYQIIYSRKIFKIYLSFRYVLSIVVGCIFIVATVLLCNYFISGFILNLFSKIIISVLFYGLSLVIFKNEIVMELVNKVKGKIRN